MLEPQGDDTAVGAGLCATPPRTPGNTSSDAMLHQAPELLGLLQQLKPLLTSVRGHLVYS